MVLSVVSRLQFTHIAFPAFLVFAACSSTSQLEIDVVDGVDCREQYMAGLGRFPTAFPRVVDTSLIEDAEFVLTGELMADDFREAARSWNDEFDFDVFAVDDRGDVSVEADEKYIYESIRNPQSQIVEGFRQPLMPTYYKQQLSEENLLQIMTYIKSLAPARTQGTQTTAPARQNNTPTGTTGPEAQGAKSPYSQRSNPVGSTPPSTRTGPGQ